MRDRLAAVGGVARFGHIIVRITAVPERAPATTLGGDQVPALVGGLVPDAAAGAGAGVGTRVHEEGEEEEKEESEERKHGRSY